jgi:hypothetical protein
MAEIETCEDCGAATDGYHVNDKIYCRPCAWAICGRQPFDDSDDEPPNAGADPYDRPDPSTNPEYWCE